LTYWDELEDEYNKLSPEAWAINHMSPHPYRGSMLQLIHSVGAYKEQLELDTMSKAGLEEMSAGILGLAEASKSDREKSLFKLWLTEISEDIYPGDNTLTKMTGGKSIDAFMSSLYSESKILSSGEDAEKCLSKAKNITKSKDPLVKVADVVVPKFQKAGATFQASGAKRRTLETKIANQAFNVYGTSLPPDATFTLRISDGIVKAYDYNGTTSPVMTTYFGLYDRHYSHNQEYPWSLPERWANPPMELLKTPLNFVSTNDIIGGNSGSAIINKNGEAVGLIFDGNIESLPGNFIFDEEFNRSVSVHAGGIIGAMKHVYKADRLVSELTGR